MGVRTVSAGSQDRDVIFAPAPSQQQGWAFKVISRCSQNTQDTGHACAPPMALRGHETQPPSPGILPGCSSPSLLNLPRRLSCNSAADLSETLGTLNLKGTQQILQGRIRTGLSNDHSSRDLGGGQQQRGPNANSGPGGSHKELTVDRASQ